MPSKRTIGVLSRQTGVKVTTIRYYESIGFLRTPDRTESGQRIYANHDVDRLNFIRHARDLGMPMNAIRDLLGLQDEPSRACTAIDAIARTHLQDVRSRLRQLASLEQELSRIVQSCDGGRVENCKVIESLSDHATCHSDHAGRILGAAGSI